MDSDQIAILLKCLEGLKSRPAMYIGRCDPELATVFLGGIASGLEICGGLDRTNFGKTRERVAKERGWQWRPIGLVREMKERGMTDMAIITELVTIETEVLTQIIPVDDARPGSSTK